jgi:hypothetical protein
MLILPLSLFSIFRTTLALVIQSLLTVMATLFGPEVSWL